MNVIYKSNCVQDSKPGEIDLHGLYVKEAIEHTDRALEEAKRRGDSEVHLIVGTWGVLFLGLWVFTAGQAKACIRRAAPQRSSRP
jgi:hypothetical protein